MFAPVVKSDAAVGGAGGTSSGGSGGTSQGGSSGQGGTAAGGTSQGGAGGGPAGAGGGVAGSGGSGGCTYTDSTDHDGDGWSFVDGDCNDCDPAVNPGAFDGVGPVGKVGVDDDCDGTPDNGTTECDTGLMLEDGDPLNAARAIGLCAKTDAGATGKDKRWGVIGAAYVAADGTAAMNPTSHGITDKFGAANPQQGPAMLVLSSGTARSPVQPGYQSPGGADMGTQSAMPAGFPKGSTLCPGVSPPVKPAYDPAALQVQVRVPTNARAFTWRFNFYSYEFPDYVCSEFNDVFTVFVDPKPPSATTSDIVFDAAGNSISVNTDLLQVCGAQTAGGHAFACPLGKSLLAGTGFDLASGAQADHAATGWLATQAPTEPGAIITLRFAIWDAGDHVLDSTVLIDAFEWMANTTPISTTPVASPK